jgi:hypothetical protein
VSYDVTVASELKPHFRQPADFALTGLVLAAPAVWVLFYVALRTVRAERWFWIALPVSVVVCVACVVARIAGGLPARDGRADVRCGLCGQSKPNAPVRYLELTGIVVVMITRELPLFCCRRCSTRAFVRTTGHTALFGFWSALAVFIAPGALLNNVAFWVSSLLGATKAAHARAVLANYRAYAKELLATVDVAGVVKALKQNTGLSDEYVEQFVKSL